MPKKHDPPDREARRPPREETALVAPAEVLALLCLALTEEIHRLEAAQDRLEEQLARLAARLGGDPRGEDF